MQIEKEMLLEIQRRRVAGIPCEPCDSKGHIKHYVEGFSQPVYSSQCTACWGFRTKLTDDELAQLRDGILVNEPK